MYLSCTLKITTSIWRSSSPLVAKLLTAGVDLWLNTPLPPLEASGTSGMKAALNGVPSLSVLDGWWIEGHVEGVTGWAIGEREPSGQGDRTQSDAASMYDKLQRVILPMFHERRDEFIDVMRHSIAMNGSFFNSHRMVEEYVLKAYVP
jgi:starch phosphorylase